MCVCVCVCVCVKTGVWIVGGRLDDEGDGYTKRWEIISVHQKSRKNFSGNKNGLGNRSGI